jgi:hypothetical protein
LCRRLLSQLAQRRELGGDLLEPGGEISKQALTGFGRRDAARGARQEPNAESGFELADGMAQRRLRNAELRRSFGETALTPDRQEGQKVVHVSALHLSRLLISPCGL